MWVKLEKLFQCVGIRLPCLSIHQCYPMLPPHWYWLLSPPSSPPDSAAGASTFQSILLTVISFTSPASKSESFVLFLFFLSLVPFHTCRFSFFSHVFRTSATAAADATASASAWLENSCQLFSRYFNYFILLFSSPTIYPLCLGPLCALSF